MAFGMPERKGDLGVLRRRISGPQGHMAAHHAWREDVEIHILGPNRVRAVVVARPPCPLTVHLPLYPQLGDRHVPPSEARPVVGAKPVGEVGQGSVAHRRHTTVVDARVVQRDLDARRDLDRDTQSVVFRNVEITLLGKESLVFLEARHVDAR